MKRPLSPDWKPASALHPTALLIAAAALAGVAPAAAQEKGEAKPAEEPPKEEAAPAPLFPDAKLEAVVRRYVFAKRDNEEPLVADDLAHLSTIKGAGAGITDLTGLEHCRRLASLDLSDNAIADLGPIQGLKHIQYLELSKNKIGDISALAGIGALQFIGLNDNQVEDLKPLAGLERTASLYLSNNKVKDISPVLGLPKLQSLYLDNNPLGGRIDGLGKVKWLSTLSLRGTGVSELGALQGLENLYFLFLEDNQIKDLGPLLAMCKKDLEGKKRFAPFVNIYLKGNPLEGEAAEAQLAEMKALHLRVKTE